MCFSITIIANCALWKRTGARAVLRLVWPSILLHVARDRVATAAETVTASPVFCPGFQKGRVPSEKGTLAR